MKFLVKKPPFTKGMFCWNTIYYGKNTHTQRDTMLNKQKWKRETENERQTNYIVQTFYFFHSCFVQIDHSYTNTHLNRRKVEHSCNTRFFFVCRLRLFWQFILYIFSFHKSDLQIHDETIRCQNMMYWIKVPMKYVYHVRMTCCDNAHQRSGAYWLWAYKNAFRHTTEHISISISFH